MSASETGAAGSKLSTASWKLWARQIGILARREARRSLLTKRRIWMYLLAFAPVLFIVIARLKDLSGAHAHPLADDTEALAGIIQFYYIRLALFFTAMGVFTWLFRGEMVERTLHYPLLTPVRREVLVVGKFLGGAAVVIAFFEVAVVACFFLVYSQFGSQGWSYVFHGQGLEQLGAYVLIVALASLGYGAVFLGLSLVFKNPIIPGALFFGWETATPILPGWLQWLSVTFYLKHLYPVALPGSNNIVFELFTVATGPISARAAAAGLVGFTIAVVAFSCYRIRRVEITYTTD